MTSCLLNKNEVRTLIRMFHKKLRLQADPFKSEEHLKQRNLIISFVCLKLKPALDATAKTWVKRGYCDLPDATSLINESIILSVDKYNPVKGKCKFTSFLWTRSKWCLLNFLATAKRPRRNPLAASLSFMEELPVVSIDVSIPELKYIKERFLVSMDETIASGDNKTTLADIIPDKSGIDDNINFNMLLDSVNRHCDEKQKVILSLLQQNYSYKEIASQLGDSPKDVISQILVLRKKLRRKLGHLRTA